MSAALRAADLLPISNMGGGAAYEKFVKSEENSNISYVQYAIIKEKTTNKPKPGAAAMTLIYTLQKFRKDVPTLTKVCGHPSGMKNSAHKS